MAVRTKFLRVLLAPLLFAVGAFQTHAQTKIAFAPDDDLETIRQKIKDNGYNFTVRENWVYNLSKAEKAKIFPLKQLPPQDQRTIAPFSDSSLGMMRKAPAGFDWRNYNGHSYIGAVRNQKRIGSCYAFAANACAETTYNYRYGLCDANCVDLSESYLVWTLGSASPYSAHFGGGAGADYEYYELMALTLAGPPEGAIGIEGVCSEANFPYTETQPSSAVIEASKQFPRILFKAWGRVYPQNYADTTEQIKNVISTYGTVDAAVLTTSAFSAYSSGIYEDSYTTPTTNPYYYSKSNHAISLVGWSDADQAWILRNSWGSTWGENGYMRIKYFSAGVNFAACYLEAQGVAGQYSVSGTISGDTQSGVLVSVSDSGTASAASNADGAFSVTGLADGTYAVTPAKSGYTFIPDSRTVNIEGGNVTGCDFTAILGGGAEFDATIGTSFVASFSQELGRKPSIYALDANDKKKTVKVTSSTKDFPQNYADCLWTAKGIPGNYALWVKGKSDGEIVNEQIGEVTLLAPTVESASDDFVPGETIEIVGQFFGRKPKAYFTYDCCGKSKKKTCKIVKGSILFDPNSGESSLDIFVPSFPKGTEEGTILFWIDSGTGAGGYP